MNPIVVGGRSKALLGPVLFRPAVAGNYSLFVYVWSNLTGLERVPIYAKGGQGNLRIESDEGVYLGGTSLYKLPVLKEDDVIAQMLPSVSPSAPTPGSPVSFDVKPGEGVVMRPKTGQRVHKRLVTPTSRYIRLVNDGDLPLKMTGFDIAGERCGGERSGFSVENCRKEPFHVPPHASCELTIQYSASCLVSRESHRLLIHTSVGSGDAILTADVARDVLRECDEVRAKLAASSLWELTKSALTVLALLAAVVSTRDCVHRARKSTPVVPSQSDQRVKVPPTSVSPRPLVVPSESSQTPESLSPQTQESVIDAVASSPASTPSNTPVAQKSSRVPKFKATGERTGLQIATDTEELDISLSMATSNTSSVPVDPRSTESAFVRCTESPQTDLLPSEGDMVATNTAGVDVVQKISSRGKENREGEANIHEVGVVESPTADEVLTPIVQSPKMETSTKKGGNNGSGKKPTRRTPMQEKSAAASPATATPPGVSPRLQPEQLGSLLSPAFSPVARLKTSGATGGSASPITLKEDTPTKLQNRLLKDHQRYLSTTMSLSNHYSPLLEPTGGRSSPAAAPRQQSVSYAHAVQGSRLTNSASEERLLPLGSVPPGLSSLSSSPPSMASPRFGPLSGAPETLTVGTFNPLPISQAATARRSPAGWKELTSPCSSPSLKPLDTTPVKTTSAVSACATDSWANSSVESVAHQNAAVSPSTLDVSSTDLNVAAMIASLVDEDDTDDTNSHPTSAPGLSTLSTTAITSTTTTTGSSSSWSSAPATHSIGRAPSPYSSASPFTTTGSLFSGHVFFSPQPSSEGIVPSSSITTCTTTIPSDSFLFPDKAAAIDKTLPQLRKSIPPPPGLSLPTQDNASSSNTEGFFGSPTKEVKPPMMATSTTAATTTTTATAKPGSHAHPVLHTKHFFEENSFFGTDYK